MVLTEQEAKTRICLQSAASAIAAERCLASQCMAWRWNMNSSNRNVSRTDGDDNSFGYCGLAGRL